MSLVAYDSEISDSEDESTSELNNEIAEENGDFSESVKSFSSSSVQGLFTALPSPKKSVSRITSVEEIDDEFLKKKAIPQDAPPGKLKNIQSEKKPARIILPSLANFEDDEDDTQKSTKFKPSVKGTGLLSMLPLPKSQQMKPTPNKFVPNILTQKPVKNILPKKETPKKGITKSSTLIDYGSSDESDKEDTDTKGAVDFFSFNDNPLEKPFPEVNIYEKVDYLKPITSDYSEESIQSVSTHNSNIIYEEENPSQQSSQLNIAAKDLNVVIDDDVLRKLGGNRGRRHKGESVEIIDINQKEILPDPREWLTKALTEDTSKRMSSSKRRGDEPTTQQRKKHQITYLAHQAKANEQELQNQWANNRLSKKQTQSKYGF